MQTFQEMGLDPDVLKALEEIGFETPTPVQQKAIPHLLSTEQDLVAFAQTGTGKTAAFSLPIIEKIDSNSLTIQCLILCPTRELCLQISNAIKSFTKYKRELRTVAVYGGESMGKQLDDLRRGAQIIVGTPGRVHDFIRRKKIDFSKVDYLVLDEADEMLTMGFKDDLEVIIGETPSGRQTLLFSATIPDSITRIAKQYMNEPLEINAGKRNVGATNVTHTFFVVKNHNRYETLKRIADMNPDIYGIVFCRTRLETKEVADMLMQDGYQADAIHGDLSQVQREHVMKKFRKRRLQLLVATDVAARGIDINELTHVINYKLPDQIEIYIHRSGRTGRAGNSGQSMSIVTNKEIGKIKLLERKIGKDFKKQLVPSGKEICEKRLFNLIDKVEKVEIDESQISTFLPAIIEKLSWLDREALISRFVSIEFNRFLEYYKDAADLNVSAKRDRSDRGDRRDRDRGGRDGFRLRDRDKGRDRRGRDRDRDRDGRKTRRDSRDERPKRRRNGDVGSFSHFHVNVGSKHKLNPFRLVNLINDVLPTQNVEIGKIEILKNFSFFDVDSKYEKEVLEAFKGADFRGEDLKVERSEPKDFDHNMNAKMQFKKKKKKKKSKKNFRSF
ncbi:MAG: DEAD/DEAH box helicase [Chitinophagales bacterium]